MKRRALFLAAVVFLAGSCEGAAQQESGAQLRNQANADVMAATRLVRQAEEMVRSARSIDTMKVSVQLFAEAGRLYESSTQKYRALIPDYASQADVDNSSQAMQYCIRSIQEIQSLAQGRRARET